MSGDEIKIISGGQTGVDRGALDAALACGVSCGGRCPRGRQAEDGVIARKYPLREIEGGYAERTELNVVESDGTVIFYFGCLSGGTEQTLLYCIQRRKPYLLIDGAELGEERAAERLAEFVRKCGLGVLNVAGPRASGEPRAYGYALNVIEKFLKARRRGGENGK